MRQLIGRPQGAWLPVAINMLRRILVLKISEMLIIGTECRKIGGIGPAPAELALPLCELNLLEDTIVGRLLVGAFTILVICGLVSVLVAEVGSLIIGVLMRGGLLG